MNATVSAAPQTEHHVLAALIETPGWDIARLFLCGLACWSGIESFALNASRFETLTAQTAAGICALIGIAITVAICLLAKHRFSARTAYLGIAVALSGMLAVAWSILDPSPYSAVDPVESPAAVMLYALVAACVVLPLIWCINAGTHSVQRRVLNAVVYIASLSIAPYLSTALLMAAASVLGALPSSWMFHLGIITLFALISLITVYVRRTSPTEAISGTPASNLTDFATRYSLTAREQDVLVWLAVGRTAGHIANNLSISKNTAVSHIRSIYQKTGVHSQQELMDLIDASQQISKSDR